MKKYLLSIYQPDGAPPPSVNLDQVMRDLNLVNQDLKTSGAWVFSDGLHPASSATVVRVKNGESLVSDGPYIEGKEHVGGLYVIQVEDLDAALGWAKRVSQATTLPIEVRPFAGHGG